MRPESLLDVEVAGEPQLSPDGAHVLYVVTRPRLSPDGYAGELWLVPAAGDAPPRRLLATDTRLGRPRWDPDGRRVALVADLGDGPQVTVLDVDTLRTRQVTKGGRVTALAWSPDGRHLAYCADPAGADGAAARIRSYARIPIRYDTLGLLEDEGPALHVVPAEGGAPRRVAGGPYTHAAPAYSPDGRWLACARVEHYSTFRQGGGEVWLFPAGGSEGRRIAGGVGFHQGLALAWCPDSRRLLYVSSHMMMTGRTPRLMLAPIDGTAPVSLTEGFDRFVGHGPGSHTDLRFGSGPVPVAASERFAYFCAGDGGAMPIFRVPLGGGAVEPVTPPGRLCVAEFSLGPGERLAYTAMDDVHAGPGVLPGPRRRPAPPHRGRPGLLAPCPAGAHGALHPAGARRPRGRGLDLPAPRAGPGPSRRCCTSMAGRICSSATPRTFATPSGSTPAGRSSSSTRRGAAGTATPSPRRCAATGAASTTRTRWPRSTTARSGAGSGPTVSR